MHLRFICQIMTAAALSSTSLSSQTPSTETSRAARGHEMTHLLTPMQASINAISVLDGEARQAIRC